MFMEALVLGCYRNLFLIAWLMFMRYTKQEIAIAVHLTVSQL